MRALGMCQVKGCNKPAKYGLYRTNPDGSKVWLHVCKQGEKIIGADNLKRAGGKYKPLRRKYKRKVA